MSSCPCSSPEGGAAPIGRLVKDALKKLGGAKPFTAQDARAVWAKAAGKKAARHSQPVSFRRSRLVVNVDSSAWLYELTLKKRGIIKKLDGKFGTKKVKEIRFRVGEVEPYG
jgi:predicted nucleic acid-binding Zn ribbon protein